MNNAWKSKIDYGHIHEKCDSVLSILGVWRRVLDYKRFLDVLAMYWNAFEALNCALTMKSVFKFLAKNCKLVMQPVCSFSCV